MKINYGEIQGKVYRKYVNWNKAVLWKDRQISIHKTVGNTLALNGVEIVEFIDRNKKNKWTALLNKVKESWELKQVGQEPQYYIPIEVFKCEKI